MAYVYKVIDEEKDELLSVVDRQFLYKYLHDYCFMNEIKFETIIFPMYKGKYLIYSGDKKDLYEVIEITEDGQRKILYHLFVC